jgi:hypothetical protein
MMQGERGSVRGLMARPSSAGQHAHDVRDCPGMAMARSAMMFFWISVEPPPMVL